MEAVINKSLKDALIVATVTKKCRKTVSNWMFDWCFWTACKNFLQDGPAAFLRERHILLRYIHECEIITKHREIEVLLAHFLLSVCDGEEFQQNFMPHKITPLEYALDAFKNLIPYFTEIPQEEITLVELEIRRQAVFVCCRSKNFEVAKKVYNNVKVEKLTSTSSSFDFRAATKEILDVLDSGDSEHPVLHNKSYAAFINFIKSYVRKLLYIIPTPFLYQVYKKVEMSSMISQKNGLGDKTLHTDRIMINESNQNCYENKTVHGDFENASAIPAYESEKQRVESTPNASPSSSPNCDSHSMMPSNSPAIARTNLISHFVRELPVYSIEEEEVHEERASVSSETTNLSHASGDLHQIMSKTPEQKNNYVTRLNDLQREKLGNIIGYLSNLKRHLPMKLFTKYENEMDSGVNYEDSLNEAIYHLKNIGFGAVICPKKKIFRQSNDTRKLKVVCVRAERDPNLSEELRSFVSRTLQEKPANKKRFRSRISNVENESPGFEESGLSYAIAKTPRRRLPNIHVSPRHFPENYYRLYKEQKQLQGQIEALNDGLDIRYRVKWSIEEMDLLYAGVKKYGLGNWVLIKNEFGFVDRSTSNLRDKWRHIKFNTSLFKLLQRRWKEKMRKKSVS